MEWVGGELLNRNERRVLIKICNWSETWTHKTWLSYFLLCWSVPSLRCSFKEFLHLSGYTHQGTWTFSLSETSVTVRSEWHFWAFPYPYLLCPLFLHSLPGNHIPFPTNVAIIFLLSCSQASNFLDWLSKSLRLSVVKLPSLTLLSKSSSLLISSLMWFTWMFRDFCGDLNGKESQRKREYMCIYIQLIHFAVQ